MTMQSLAEGQGATLPAGAMIRVQAHPLGRTGGVELEIRGAATANRVDPATVAVIDVAGAAEILLRPAGGGDFGPGCAAQVVLGRGRPGSAAAEAVELPRLTLDGRGEVLAGTITRRGAELRIRAAATGSGRLEGPAATVRAGLRSAFDAGRADLRGVRAVRLHLDCSASMSDPRLPALLPAAAAVVVGAAGAAEGIAAVRLHDPSGVREVPLDRLAGEIAAAVAAGAARVGGVGAIGRDPGELTLVLADAVPAIGPEGPPAVALVLGADPARVAAAAGAAPAVLAVDEALAADLDAGRVAAAAPAVAAIAAAAAAGAAADGAPGAGVAR